MIRFWAMALAVMLTCMSAAAQAQEQQPGFIGAVQQQLCGNPPSELCPERPPETDLSKLYPGSPEMAAMANRCEAGKISDCHRFAQVLEGFLRGYSARRTEHGCKDPATRTEHCTELDRVQVEIAALVGPANAAYGLACDGAIELACIQGARLALSLNQAGSKQRAEHLLATGCARKALEACADLAKLGTVFDIDLANLRLAAGRLCVETGAAQHCNDFGNALEAGLGGPDDLVAARDALALGCNPPNVHRDACWSYGKMLLAGKGGPVDRKGARAAFQRHCDLNPKGKTKRCKAAEDIRL